MVSNPLHQILFRDIANAYIGQASEGEWDSLDIVQNWCDVGVIKVKIASQAQIYPRLNQIYGLAARRNGTVLASGPIEKPDLKWDTQNSPGDLEAYSYERLLQDRLTYPSVSTAGGSPGFYTFTTPNDVFTGTAEDALYHFAQNNLGSAANGADGTRQNTVLTFGTSLARGATIKDSLRFKYLLKSLQDITYFEPSLGFTITETGSNNQLIFNVVASRDLTQSVVFSKGMGNLYDVEYDQERPICNAVVMLGSGTGTGRTVYIATNPDSIAQYGRIEQTVNAANTGDHDTLAAQATAYLNENAFVYSIKLHVNDTASTMTQFGVTYQVGDKIRLIDPSTGTTIDQVLRSVHFTVDTNGGEKLELVMATPKKKHKIRKKNGIINIQSNINDLQGQV